MGAILRARCRLRGACVAVAIAVAAVGGCAAAAVAEAETVQVSVTSTRQGRPVASDFLGLALEYSPIPGLAGSSNPKTVDPVAAQLIRNLDPGGRPVLRIGGQSADRSWWPVAGMRRPPGITYDLSPAWTRSARALAQATNAKLILGVELEANRPRIDAVEGGHLLTGIGRPYLSAFEIGNEPELYTGVPWYRTLDGRALPWYSHDGTRVYARPPTYGPAQFASDFGRAEGALPAVPIAGPVSGNVRYLDAFRRFVSPRSRVRTITWHAYGLNNCVKNPSSPEYPSVPNLLRLSTSRDIVNGVGPYIGLAHRDGAAFRIDEMNSVTCNGRLGVSNTMASALWMMDALFTMAAHGVDGVNIHTYPQAANGLFDFLRSHGRWEGMVHAPYYGALMFEQAAPAGSRLLALHAGSQQQVRAWATLGPDHRERVLLINDSLTASAQALVAGVGAGPATVARLRAPSAYATGGLSLGGVGFGARTATGALPAVRAQSVTPRSGRYTVTMPAASAALLTVAPAGALPG